MNRYVSVLILSCLLGITLSFFTEISTYELLALTFTAFAFLIAFFEFGRSIAVRELMGFIATLQLLFSSAIVFIFDPSSMAVSSDAYFSYILPAVFFYYIGLVMPFFRMGNHVAILEQTKISILSKRRVITVLLAIGIVGSLTYTSLPLQLKAIVYLLAICLYASVMYSHFAEGTLRKITLFTAFGLLIYTTIREGAFGSLIFWITLYVVVVSTGTRRGKSASFKLAIIAVGILFVVVIQSIKFDYRAGTWGTKITERRADPELLVKLIRERFEQPDYLVSSDHLLSVSERLNQGQYVALSMYYVPRFEQFANGEILLHFIYPIIPRLMWAGKPITGGEANIDRFTPMILTRMSSFNISPFGEAYVNFGNSWGIVFMFFYGLIFNGCFSAIMRISEQKPTALLWIPCVFNVCLTVETDVLSMWGGFITTTIFIVILWQLFKRLRLEL